MAPILGPGTFAYPPRTPFLDGCKAIWQKMVDKKSACLRIGAGRRLPMKAKYSALRLPCFCLASFCHDCRVARIHLDTRDDGGEADWQNNDGQKKRLSSHGRCSSFYGLNRACASIRRSLEQHGARGEQMGIGCGLRLRIQLFGKRRQSRTNPKGLPRLRR